MIVLAESQLVEFAKTVELTATKVLDGLHRSPRGGVGIEFHGAIPYSEGEDARFIDWKRWAATDRYFVNKFRKEERNGWSIWVDSSSSMKYGAKYEQAIHWAGTLMFLAQVWGDTWSLVGTSAESIEEGFRTLMDLPKDSFSARDIRTSRSNRLILISDFFFDWKNFVSKLEPEFHQIVLLQILDKQEVDFNFEGVIDFRDLESSDKLVLDSRTIRQAYNKELTNLRNELKKQASENLVYFEFVAGSETIENGLLRFFEKL